MSAVLAHLSDLHFGAHRPELLAALETALSALGPDLVVVTGDVTQRAREREFRAAASFLGALAAPVLVVPGNHDIPAWNLFERFGAPLGRYRRHLGHEPYPVHRGPGVVVAGLNSARPFGAHPDWSRGRVSRRQLDALCGRLGPRQDGTTRVVAVHHPFLLSAAARGRGAVGRRSLALDGLSACGVDLLLSGHLHLAYSGVVRGAGGTLVAVQAGSAVSHRLKSEPNAFNRIAVAPGRIEVQPMVWDGAGFTPGEPRRYRRGDGGWQVG